LLAALKVRQDHAPGREHRHGKAGHQGYRQAWFVARAFGRQGSVAARVACRSGCAACATARGVEGNCPLLGLCRPRCPRYRIRGHPGYVIGWLPCLPPSPGTRRDPGKPAERGSRRTGRPIPSRGRG
jgi:hypothetical protein